MAVKLHRTILPNAYPAGLGAVLEEFLQGDFERVGDLDQRADRGIPGATLQVSQVAALNRRLFREHFLGPTLGSPQRFEALGEAKKGRGLRYRQALIVSNCQAEFCMIGVT